MSTPMNIGAWRDRTNLFISYRQSYTHHPAKRTRFTGPSSNSNSNAFPSDSESAGLLAPDSTAADGDAVIEMDLLPPRWLDIQDEITSLLSSISTQMKKLDQLHAKHVLPGFDDESVKLAEEREIESLTHEITRGFTSCQTAIRRIDRLVQQQQGGGKATQEEEKMARNLKIALATRVGDVSTIFRKKQSAYLKKLRALGGMSIQLDSTPRGGTPSQATAANPYTDPAMQDSELDRSSAQSTLQQTTQMRRRTGVLDSAIEQREREIEKIAQGVIGLSNLFQDLNSMVIDQGSLLDRIDYNVERTVEHVQAADKELTVATGYQKKSTKRKILLLLILLVVGMFILLLIKPRKSHTAAPVVEAPRPNDPGNGLPPRSIWDAQSQRRRWEWKQRRRRSFGGSSLMPV